MKKYLIFIALIIISTNCSAEIKQVIDDYSTFRAGHGFSPYPVTGRFEFINLPAPLEETNIHFTLEFVDNENAFTYSESQLNMDWEIYIGYDNTYLKLLSDSVFTWSGPHKLGDKYSGEIRCISLASGNNGFNLVINRNGQTALPVHWKIDEKGKLKHLDKSKHKPGKKVDYLHTFFFKDDSVYFKRKYKSRLFNSEITIKPTPKIGDTSVVHIRLRANKDLLNGMDQLLTTVNINIVSFPENLFFPIYKDQVVDLFFKIIPQPINSSTGFTFQFFSDINNKRESDKFDLDVSMIFNNDGTLHFVSDRGFYNSEKYIPTKFKEKKNKKHIFNISKDKDSKVKQIK